MYGYEASGLATTDIVTYSIDRFGKIHNEFWLHQPYETPGLIHGKPQGFCSGQVLGELNQPMTDCAITPNWLVLFIWPFEASVERMKRGGHHWAWTDDRAFTISIVPRNAQKPVAKGWTEGETRSYDWTTCMPIHTAAAWEDVKGNILVESSRVHDNAFPFFPPDTDNPRMPAPETRADFVRWKIDPTQPDRSRLPDPKVILDSTSDRRRSKLC